MKTTKLFFAIFAITMVAIMNPAQAQSKKELRNQLNDTQEQLNETQTQLDETQKTVNQVKSQNSEMQGMLTQLLNEVKKQNTTSVSENLPKSTSELILAKNQEPIPVKELTEVEKKEKELAIAKANEKFEKEIRAAAEKKEAELKAIEDGKKVNSGGAVSNYKSSKGELAFDEEKKIIYYRTSDKEAMEKYVAEHSEYQDWGKEEEPR